MKLCMIFHKTFFRYLRAGAQKDRCIKFLPDTPVFLSINGSFFYHFCCSYRFLSTRFFKVPSNGLNGISLS